MDRANNLTLNTFCRRIFGFVMIVILYLHGFHPTTLVNLHGSVYCVALLVDRLYGEDRARFAALGRSRVPGLGEPRRLTSNIDSYNFAGGPQNCGFVLVERVSSGTPPG